MRWLAGYRHPRHYLPGTAGRLVELLGCPRPLMELAGLAGDPIAVLPVMFHLLWRHELDAEMSVPLHPAVVVRAAGAAW